MSRLQQATRFLGLSRPGQQPLLSPRAGAVYLVVLAAAAGLMITASALTINGRSLALTAPLYGLGMATVIAQSLWATRRRRQQHATT